RPSSRRPPKRLPRGAPRGIWGRRSASAPADDSLKPWPIVSSPPCSTSTVGTCCDSTLRRPRRNTPWRLGSTPQAGPSSQPWSRACITTCSAAWRAMPRDGSASTRKRRGSGSMRRGERAGVTGIAACFGYRSRRLSRDADTDTRAAVVPGSARRLPPTWRVLRRLPAESLAVAATALDADRCAPHLPTQADTLARTMRGAAVALRLRFPSRGEAILLADARYLSNRILKDTDAGVAVLPWFLDGRTRQVVVDEYHLGFGAGGTLPGASWAWLRHHPAGWAILQLFGVA